MQRWVAFLGLFGASLAVPSLVLATNCNEAIKSALNCPSGYEMTCVTEGYERWVCAKMVDGVVVPLGVPEPKHDVIETSKTGAGYKQAAYAPAVKQKPAPVKQVDSKKPVVTGSATSALAHEKKEEGFKGGIKAWLDKLFGRESDTHATSSKHATSTGFLSNKYFVEIIKGWFK